MEIKQQVQQGISINDDATFGELVDAWEKYYTPKATVNWVYQQRHNIDKHLMPHLVDRKAKSLKKFDLQSLLNLLADKGYSTSTMKKLKIVAVQILEVARDKGLIIENPFRDVKVVEIKPNERRALTDIEIDLITDTWKDHRMGHVALIMLYCGLRRGEIMALNWSDIDFEGKMIQVTKAISIINNQPVTKEPKSKAGIREVPIPDFLIDVLRNVEQSSTIVCPDTKGLRMTDVAYRRAWSSYEYYINLQAGGEPAKGGNPKVTVLDHITAHMLRHTYASLLYEANVDIKSAQRFLGHSDIDTTLEIYTHLTKRKEEEAINSLNAHLSNRLNRDKQSFERDCR